jgi:hypothetical protein
MQNLDLKKEEEEWQECKMEGGRNNYLEVGASQREEGERRE